MDNKELQKWALIAEIVGGLAVVVTLIFLVFEVRANSNLIRANAFDQNMQSLLDWRMDLISTNEGLEMAAERWSLGDIDNARRNLTFQTLWNLYEKAYYAHEYELIGDAEWERFDYNICENYRVEVRDLNWNVGIIGTEETGLAQRLTSEFVQYVESMCD